MSTTSAEEYADFCGPRALSAIVRTRGTGVDALAAARCLLAWQRSRGIIHAPSTGNEIALALDYYGFAATPYDVIAGTPSASARDHLDRVRSSPAVQQLSDAQYPELIAAVFPAGFGDYPRLREWLARAGLWLVAVHIGHQLHAMALRDGRVLAGDVDERGSIYGDTPVVMAHRITWHLENAYT